MRLEYNSKWIEGATKWLIVLQGSSAMEGGHVTKGTGYSARSSGH